MPLTQRPFNAAHLDEVCIRASSRLEKPRAVVTPLRTVSLLPGGSLIIWLPVTAALQYATSCELHEGLHLSFFFIIHGALVGGGEPSALRSMYMVFPNAAPPIVDARVNEGVEVSQKREELGLKKRQR